MPGVIPNPTPIYRLMHIDNLDVCLTRDGLHATNCVPQDGLQYKTIHNVAIQRRRSVRRIPCGPGGVVHDYVPFYFGYLSPMMFQLHTDQVQGYTEGQEPLAYLVSTVQEVSMSGAEFVFSDGHGIAGYTQWFDDLTDLSRVDWNMVYQRYWSGHTGDMDQQRRKQAEFLVHRFCPWGLIKEAVVIDATRKAQVERIFDHHSATCARPVRVKRDWYY